MRSFEMVALALGFSLVVGCGSEGTSADDVGRLSAALCVEPRLTPLRVTASSSESASYSPERAADGNASTRWSSVFADSAWIQLDFGVARQLERVVLKWETAASKSYTLGISDSESGPFTTIYTQTNGKGGTETASGLHGSGRYLRLTSTARTTGFGISLFELEAYAPVDGACGSPSPKCGSAPLRAVAASASSIESSDYPPSEAIDGIVGTSCGAGNRWSSAYADQQWLMLDLGQPRHLDRVVLRWECAASASYDIQVGLSPTGPWATVYSDPAGNGGVDDARGLNATARYVRVYSRKRTKPFGVSLYEVEIYGDADPMCGVGACTNPALENRTSLSIKSSSIGARVSADTVRSAMRIAQDPSTKKVYLWADSGLRELDLETLSSAPVVSRSAIASALPAGSFFSDVQGMAFGPEGNVYLVGNEDHGSTNVGLVVKGTPSSSGWSWSLLARTAEIPDSNTNFDHHWNGVVVSPDGRYVYVASGSRTDHGELQTQNGRFPGLREAPLTSTLFRLPTAASSLLLANDEAQLGDYRFAKGLRNAFDPAFAPGGGLMVGENGPDADYSEELNLIEQGAHYGFPWRFGNVDNATRQPSYDPATDHRLRPGYVGVDNNFYYNDPTFPPPPAAFVDPIVNHGPDADLYRDPETGGIVDASAVSGTLSTFTGHRSPLGLSFDVAGRLCGDFKGQAFILSFGAGVARTAANDMFPDAGRDLLGLRLTPTPAGGFELETRQLITGFSQPIDSLLLGGKLYVIEYGGAGHVYEISLPVSG